MREIDVFFSVQAWELAGIEAVLVEKLKKVIDPLQKSVDSLLAKVSAYEKEITLPKEVNVVL